MKILTVVCLRRVVQSVHINCGFLQAFFHFLAILLSLCDGFIKKKTVEI